MGYTEINDLMWAARNGDTAYIKVLMNIGYKTRINEVDRDGFSAITWGVIGNKPEAIKVLIDFDGDPNIRDKNGVPPLLRSIMKRHDSISKLLISTKKVNLNAQDQNGYSSLIAAAATNQIEIVKLLIEADANLNLQNNKKLTAYQYAVKYKHIEIATLLLESGAICMVVSNER